MIYCNQISKIVLFVNETDFHLNDGTMSNSENIQYVTKIREKIPNFIDIAWHHIGLSVLYPNPPPMFRWISILVKLYTMALSKSNKI